MLKNKFVYKKTKQPKQPKQPGHCPPCLITLLTIPHFQSYRTKETFQIFHNLSWKSESLIYLLQCHICQLHYAGKSETHFNIRLNNNRKDAKSQYSILVCKHCYKQDHDFRHAEFTLIEQINTQPPEKQEHIK